MKRHLGIVLALSVGGLSSIIGLSCQRQEQPAPEVTRAPDPMFTEGANMKAALHPIRDVDGISPRLVQREGTFTCPNPPPPQTDEEKCGSVLDGCVAEGENPVIFRFGHGTRNVGYSRLYTPLVPANAPACACLGPEPPGCQGACCLSNYSNDDWVWSCAHGHHHLKDWGVYHLIDNQTKLLVSTAVKYSFLAGFALGPEGGWDDYGDKLPCQFIRVDPNMQAGSYTLAQEVNAAYRVEEIRELDNAVAQRVTFTRTGPESFTAIDVPSAWESSASNLATALGSSTPAAISREINGNDLFWVGSNGHLFRKTKAPTSNWTPTSGGTQISPTNQTYPLVGGPAAVAMGKGRMEVFARNSNNEIRQHSWTTAAGWSSTTFASFAAAPPAAVSVSRSRALVAWLDADGFLRSRAVPGFPKIATGAQFPTNQRPALAASDHNTYHVFLRAADGTVKYNRYSWATSMWTGWVSLGGSVTGQLSAVSPYYRQALVFARGTDNQLRFLKVEIDPADVEIDFEGWQNGTIAWTTPLLSSWMDGGATGLFGDPVAIATADKIVDVFYYQTPEGGGYALYKRRQLQLVNMGAYNQMTPPSWSFQWTSDPFSGTLIGIGNPPMPLQVSSWAAGTFDLFLQQSSGFVHTHLHR